MPSLLGDRDPRDPRRSHPVDPDRTLARDERELRAFEARVAEIISQAGLEPETCFQANLRNRPSTPKGEQTVIRLLDASLDVIGKRGIRGTNTRAIAEEAGVNVATLYQYFEDVDSLLEAAALREQALRTGMMSERVIELAGGAPLDEWIDRTVDLIVNGSFVTDRHRAVMIALQALPSLSPVPRLGWETAARILATTLSFRFGGDPEEYWLPYARTAQSATRLVTDDAVMDGEPENLNRVWQVYEMAWEYLLARVPGQSENRS